MHISESQKGLITVLLRTRMALGQFHMRNVIPLPLTCEDKRPNVKRRTWNVGQISNQNEGGMMKIEMKHHPGVTVL